MLYGNRLRTFYVDPLLVELDVCEADVVIGAVLLPGSAAPKLVTRDIVRKMKAGTVAVDVAIDQGGCCETSKPTTHTDPTFVVNRVLHYCVANMPGAVARTSTFALTNAIYPFIEALASRGMVAALLKDHHLRNGLSVHRGNLTSEPVA
jgi:alanine dehydrogenase